MDVNRRRGVGTTGMLFSALLALLLTEFVPKTGAADDPEKPEPSHFIVLEGLRDGYSSRYTIKATKGISRADGKLAGIAVVADGEDRIEGRRVDGTVWADADGFRITGGIARLVLEKPENVRLHVGPLSSEARGKAVATGATETASDGEDPASSPNNDTNQAATGCEKQVSARSIAVLQAQGRNEGKLELRLSHVMGDDEEEERLVLGAGETRPLEANFAPLAVDAGQTVTRGLTTKVWEEEWGRDWSTGEDDYGESANTLKLTCGTRRTLATTVDLAADAEPPARVRVVYEVVDAPSD